MLETGLLKVLKLKLKAFSVICTITKHFSLYNEIVNLVPNLDAKKKNYSPSIKKIKT